MRRRIMEALPLGDAAPLPRQLVITLCSMIKKTPCVSSLHKSSAVVEMGDRLATIDMGRKVGAAVSLFLRGSWVPHVAQCGLG